MLRGASQSTATEPPRADSTYTAAKRARPMRLSSSGPRTQSEYMLNTMWKIELSLWTSATVSIRHGSIAVSGG